MSASPIIGSQRKFSVTENDKHDPSKSLFLSFLSHPPFETDRGKDEKLPRTDIFFGEPSRIFNSISACLLPIRLVAATFDIKYTEGRAGQVIERGMNASLPLSVHGD